MEFNFQDIEKPGTRVLKNRINEAKKARRGGLDIMYCRGSNTFRNFCKVVIAGALALPLFFTNSNTGETSDRFVAFFNTGWASVITITLILVLSITAGRFFQIAASKLFGAWKGWPKDLIKANFYINEYTGENGASKDIRLVDQETLINNELHQCFDNPHFLRRRLRINIKYDTMLMTNKAILPIFL